MAWATYLLTSLLCRIIGVFSFALSILGLFFWFILVGGIVVVPRGGHSVLTPVGAELFLLLGFSLPGRLRRVRLVLSSLILILFCLAIKGRLIVRRLAKSRFQSL